METLHGDELKISLRLMDVNDADDMMVWGSDPLVAKYCPWEPRSPSRENAIEYINTKVIPHPYHRAICVNNRAVGALTVTKNSGEDSCRGELGYIIASKWWDHGIATTAVKILVSKIFKEWQHLERLEALVDVENKASQRVLEKVGFVMEGVLKRYVVMKGRVCDMVMFSIIRSDLRNVS